MTPSHKAVVAWHRKGMRPRRCSFHTSCVVGRDVSCRILCIDPTASRRHVELRPTGGGLRIHNLSRHAPVRAGGQSLAPGASLTLRAGQTLTVVDVDIEVLVVPVATPPGLIRCANLTCDREIEPHHLDCPWCGRSLAFAFTQARRRP